MKVGGAAVFCGMMWIADVSGCTEPIACTTDLKLAIKLRVRSPNGVEDVTPTARVDVTRNGEIVPQSAVLYPGATTGTIGVGGSGGNYSVVVHHPGYRDTTVTARVLDAQCGPITVALVVNLTAL